MAVRELIRQLGGATEVARRIGITAAAVSNWSAEEKIPPRHHAALFLLAQERGVPWVPPGFEKIMTAAEDREAA